MSCPPPGDLPDPGIDTASLTSPTLAGGFFTTRASLGGPAGEESACNAGDLGSISGLGRSPGEENGYLLQYSGLENSMDPMVHGVAKSWTQLSNFHFTFYH